MLLLPLLDMGLAVVRRMGQGKSPFHPDRRHLHHRLLQLGHSHRRAVVIMYLWTALFAFGAAALAVESTRGAGGFGVGALVALGLTLGPLRGRSCTARSPTGASNDATRERPRGRAGRADPPRAFRRALRDMLVLVALVAVLGAVGGALLPRRRSAGRLGRPVGVAVTLVFSGTTVVSMLRTVAPARRPRRRWCSARGWARWWSCSWPCSPCSPGGLLRPDVLAVVLVVGVVGSAVLDYRAVRPEPRAVRLRPGA